MATFTLTDVQVFSGGYDLRSQTNEVSLDVTVDDLDSTTFGSDGVKAHSAGLKDISASMKGFTDPLVSDDLFAQMGGSDLIVSLSPTRTVGETIYGMRGALVGSFTNEETVGNLRSFSAALTNRNQRGVVRGTMLRALGAATASGTGTSVSVGAASSTQTVCSWVHLTSLSGTGTPTLTVTIQRDDNSGFTSPTTLHSHTALTAVGANWAETSGAVTDSFYRVTWTLSGTTPSATFLVGLGIS